MMIFIIFVALIRMACSIRSPPNNPLSQLAYTNSSHDVHRPVEISLVLPLLHRDHPEIQSYFHSLSMSPMEEFESVYFMQLFVGKTPYFGVLDTGSPFTWFSVSKNFNPTLSDTYKSVPCGESCSKIPRHSCTPDSSQCLFQIVYIAGATSGGDVGRDTFYFYGSNNAAASTVTAPMVFGVRTYGNIPYPGVVGMARHPVGLLTALGVERFSICFPRPPKLKSSIRFGSDANLLGEITPFQPNLWHLNFKVESITIGGFKLTNLASGSMPGTLFTFDTGSQLTHLHAVAMDGVLEQVRNQVKAVLIAKKHGDELCYKIRDKAAYKDLAFSFQLNGGGSLYFDFENIWRSFEGYDCLAFKRSPWNISIFGAKQMGGWNFGFDYQWNELSYYKSSC